VITHTFTTAGNTTVTLQVKDDANASGSYTAIIDVHAPPKKTPGFEIFFVFLAILVCLGVYSKKKR